MRVCGTLKNLDQFTTLIRCMHKEINILLDYNGDCLYSELYVKTLKQDCW